MKKYILVLGIIACLLAPVLWSAEAEAGAVLPEDQVAGFAEGLVEEINQIVRSGSIEIYASDPVVYEGMKSFAAALEEMGEYQSVLSHNVVFDDRITVELELKGSQRNGIFRLVLNQEGIWEEMSAQVVYGFGETMAKAGLNTLMGMATVFSVLILIILIISSFSLIGRAQNKKPKMAKKPQTVHETETETEEELASVEENTETDDSELIAVIAAAVAAYEAAAGKVTVSGDNYVVRSIKRRYR